MQPEVVEAIGRLQGKRILSEAQASLFLRVARRQLVSVHHELRVLLYGGVLLATTGVGIFLRENHERLGPVVIASVLGAGALLCLVYAFRHSLAFSWQSVPSPHLAVDYVLLLGVLLLGSDIAYLESRFTLLGPRWPYHLLFMSVLYLAAAYRFDSRVVLSLALSSFAAWRGVSVALSSVSGGGHAESAVRTNALGCGALFVAMGILSVRWKRKPHFEPVWVTLGLVLFLGGLLSGAFQDAGSNWFLWEIPLLLAAGSVIVAAYRLRRPLDFALGVLAAYLGAIRFLTDTLSGSTLMFTVGISSLAVIAFLVGAQRRMKESA